MEPTDLGSVIVHPVAGTQKRSVRPLTSIVTELPNIIEKGHFVDYAVPYRAHLSEDECLPMEQYFWPFHDQGS